jgi:hypothetical protein
MSSTTVPSTRRSRSQKVRWLPPAEALPPEAEDIQEAAPAAEQEPAVVTGTDGSIVSAHRGPPREGQIP